ncbi:MAG TPA: hypothetical protein VL595_13310 [Pseudonocardia sp.]|nr:hypothetical protein [Pseudonocardia sp.]
MRWLDRLLRRPPVPDWLRRVLEDDEYVLASSVLASPEPDDVMLVATSHGIWLPEQRRIGWHLVSKATWSDGTLTLIEAVEEPLEAAVLLSDLPVRRFPLADPGKLPQTVHQRVQASILSRHRRDLADGGVWLVQRKVPGRGLAQLQVRPDPGTDADAARRIAAEAPGGIELDH